MTINNVKVLAGFRFVLTNEDKWQKFCQELHEHVHGDDGDDDNGSEHSEHSEHSDCNDCNDCNDCDDCDGSGSEHSDEHCDLCDEVDPTDAVWDNMHLLMESLREKFPDLEYHTIKCFHNKEGMDRMIDIGFEFGDFSICGDHEGSHESIDRTANALKEVKKPAFPKTIAELFLWKYCVNKKEPKTFGQANNCMYCENEDE